MTIIDTHLKRGDRQRHFHSYINFELESHAEWCEIALMESNGGHYYWRLAAGRYKTDRISFHIDFLFFFHFHSVISYGLVTSCLHHVSQFYCLFQSIAIREKGTLKMNGTQTKQWRHWKRHEHISAWIFLFLSLLLCHLLNIQEYKNKKNIFVSHFSLRSELLLLAFFFCSDLAAVDRSQLPKLSNETIWKWIQRIC